MGGGDWNDGMNLVGIKGIGESVRLGWFVYSTIDNFISLCKYKEDKLCVKKYNNTLSNLKKDIEKHAWDGEWYMRAFYDNGKKLGSKENQECRIDSISQSWSVISGAGSIFRAHQSLYSAKRYLVNQKESISLLLAPPFDKTENNPGYIKDYYPGIRENGGQYTHASVWLAIANAIIKDCETTRELLDMLNPIRICSTKNSVSKYEKEPYVVVADISMGETFSGRGGWSWYTGSAGWLYQATTRWFLGIRRQGENLIIDPATPVSFGDFEVEYKYKNTLYQIAVKRGDMIDFHIKSVTVDGKTISGKSIELVDDGKVHKVIVHASK
jgi:cellobiose phosphorylase